MDNKTITKKQIEQAIQVSGYLLEQRVESILSKEGYYVEANSAFLDSDTGKSREIDIKALTAKIIDREKNNIIFPLLLCECENNLQPVVFFTKKSPTPFLHHWEAKISGIPVKFLKGDIDTTLPEFFNFEKFHHYCIEEVSTQYCTFQLKKDKTEWMALHNEEQHATFSSLIKAVEYEIMEHIDSYILPKTEEDYVNLQIYYPIVILQGQLFTATLKNGNLHLSTRDHVQFRKEYLLTGSNKLETYQIDIITEKYLKKYLKLIEQEMEKMKELFQRKENDVFKSIQKIVKEAKRLQKEDKPFSHFLRL